MPSDFVCVSVVVGVPGLIEDKIVVIRVSVLVSISSVEAEETWVECCTSIADAEENADDPEAAVDVGNVMIYEGCREAEPLSPLTSGTFVLPGKPPTARYVWALSV